MIDELSIKLKTIKPEETLRIDGIEFSNAIVVELKVKKKDGKYLIFTSASGIADVGGWSGVLVKQNEKYVYWSFEFNDKPYNYKFNKSEYTNSILKLKEEIDEQGKLYDLEPVQVFFPECW